MAERTLDIRGLQGTPRDSNKVYQGLPGSLPFSKSNINRGPRVNRLQPSSSKPVHHLTHGSDVLHSTVWTKDAIATLLQNTSHLVDSIMQSASMICRGYCPRYKLLDHTYSIQCGTTSELPKIDTKKITGCELKNCHTLRLCLPPVVLVSSLTTQERGNYCHPAEVESKLCPLTALLAYLLPLVGKRA